MNENDDPIFVGYAHIGYKKKISVKKGDGHSLVHYWWTSLLPQIMTSREEKPRQLKKVYNILEITNILGPGTNFIIDIVESLVPIRHQTMSLSQNEGLFNMCPLNWKEENNNSLTYPSWTAAPENTSFSQSCMYLPESHLHSLFWLKILRIFLKIIRFNFSV